MGLGNTGKEYAKTRHNVGMLCINYIAKQQKVSFKPKVWWLILNQKFLASS